MNEIIELLTTGWVGKLFAWMFLLYVAGAVLLFAVSTLSLLLGLIRYRNRAVVDQRLENFRTFAQAYLSGGDVHPAGRLAVISAWEALEGEDNPYHLEVMKMQAEVAGGDQEGLARMYEEMAGQAVPKDVSPEEVTEAAIARAREILAEKHRAEVAGLKEEPEK